MEILLKFFFLSTILVQFFATLWAIGRLLCIILKKTKNRRLQELKIRDAVYWIGYVMTIIMGIAIRSSSDDLLRICVFYGLLLLSLFIMLFQTRWKILYGGNEVHIQNYWGKAKTYLKDELSEECNGRISYIYHMGKCVAKYDMVLVKVEESVSLTRFIYERERQKKKK